MNNTEKLREKSVAWWRNANTRLTDFPESGAKYCWIHGYQKAELDMQNEIDRLKDQLLETNKHVIAIENVSGKGLKSKDKIINALRKEIEQDKTKQSLQQITQLGELQTALEDLDREHNVSAEYKKERDHFREEAAALKLENTTLQQALEEAEASNQQLKIELKVSCEELEANLNNEYPGSIRVYPHNERKYQSEMADINARRKLAEG